MPDKCNFGQICRHWSHNYIIIPIDRPKERRQCPFSIRPILFFFKFRLLVCHLCVLVYLVISFLASFSPLIFFIFYKFCLSVSTIICLLFDNTFHHFLPFLLFVLTHNICCSFFSFLIFSFFLRNL